MHLLRKRWRRLWRTVQPFAADRSEATIFLPARWARFRSLIESWAKRKGFALMESCQYLSPKGSDWTLRFARCK